MSDTKLYARDLRSLATNMKTLKKIANTVDLNLNEKKRAIWETKKDEIDYLKEYKKTLNIFPKVVESKYKHLGIQQKKFNLKLNEENIHELLRKKI